MFGTIANMTLDGTRALCRRVLELLAASLVSGAAGQPAWSWLRVGVPTAPAAARHSVLFMREPGFLHAPALKLRLHSVFHLLVLHVPDICPLLSNYELYN